jgi:epoxyqueuosine reductase
MNIKTAIVPFSCFENLKEDFKEFSKRQDLNDFQKWIINERYVLNPQLDFEPKSLVVTVSPSSLKRAVFIRNGKRYESPIIINTDSFEIKQHLIQSTGHSFFYDYWLPAKRTAVRSGLCEYGRNNICYSEDYGSFIGICVFLSDLPCPDGYVWREVKNMEICDNCRLCENNCPTGAILTDRFLLENVKCLSAFNEDGGTDFPAFIPETVHHSIVNCFRCQESCPLNKGKLDNIKEEVLFNEEETQLLLNGTPIDRLPQVLAEKIKSNSMVWYYQAIPRNLKAMIKAAELRIKHKQAI